MRPIEELDSTSTRHTFDHLETSRKYKLVIYSSENGSRSQAVELFVHTAPILPPFISPSSQSAEEIIVEWQNGPYPVDVTSIEIIEQNGRSSVATRQIVDNIPHKSYRESFTGLKPKTYYTVKLFTIKDGISSNQWAQSLWTEMPEIPPPSPKNLRVVDATLDTVTVSWTVNPDPNIAYWHVTRIGPLSEKPFMTKDYKFGGESTIHKLVDFQPGEEYRLEIRSVGKNRLKSAPLIDTISTLPPSPTDLSFNNGQLTWSSDSPNVDFFNLVIYHNTRRLLTETIRKTHLTKNTHSFAVPGLASSSSYHAQLVAVTGSGAKSKTVSLDFRTIPAQIEFLGATEVGTDYITLAWAPSPVASKYEITYSNQRGTTKSEETTDHTKQIFGLMASTEYKFEIRIIDGNGLKSRAATATFATSLPPPTRVKFKALTDTSVKVSWGSSGVWVDNYKVTFSSDRSNPLDKIVPSSKNSTVFNDLKMATLYQAWVSNKLGFLTCAVHSLPFF